MVVARRLLHDDDAVAVCVQLIGRRVIAKFVGHMFSARGVGPIETETDRVVLRACVGWGPCGSRRVALWLCDSGVRVVASDRPEAVVGDRRGVGRPIFIRRPLFRANAPCRRSGDFVRQRASTGCVKGHVGHLLGGLVGGRSAPPGSDVRGYTSSVEGCRLGWACADRLRVPID